MHGSFLSRSRDESEPIGLRTRKKKSPRASRGPSRNESYSSGFVSAIDGLKRATPLVASPKIENVL